MQSIKVFINPDKSNNLIQRFQIKILMILESNTLKSRNGVRFFLSAENKCPNKYLTKFLMTF
jgi:hypothetical protein